MLSKLVHDPQYGARPIQRYIQKHLESRRWKISCQRWDTLQYLSVLKV
ncbi:MAG: hypothetical protein LBU89_11140 [Fibromonadaceae bacterium]|nr:hypothetical protein [Fibromonadaceae bacterium]